MVDNILPDHVGQPNVLVLSVQLFWLMTRMGRGVIMRLFPYSTPWWLKVMGGEGGGDLCDFSVSPNPFFFSFFRDFVGLGLGLWTLVRQFVFWESLLGQMKCYFMCLLSKISCA